MAKIAVDVTPLLPGGINGGAKPMVIALLQELPQLLNNDEFILLTADYSHDELAFLDRSNLRRICVHRSSVTREENQASVSRKLLQKTRALVLQWLPQKIKWWLRAVYYQLRPPGTFVSIIKQIGIDFLFCPFSAPTFYELGVPVLSVVYDLQFIDYPGFFAESDLFYRQLHFDQICKLSDHVATISEFTRQSVIKNSVLVPEQVTTIHIGLVHDFAAQFVSWEVQSLFDRLDIKPQGYLFYPANFWKHKNHRALLRAFQIFRQRFPDSNLKIVCTGALDERRVALSSEVVKMGLEQHVVMPGFLPDHEIGILYQGAKGLIFPSLYEGFGIPVLEAMDASVPVACSKVTSLPEIGGDAVLYFDPKDIQDISQAIESLEFDDNLRSQLIQKGKERLPLFGNAKTMAQKYADLIHQILRTGKRIYFYNLRGLTDDGWFQQNAYLALPIAPQERCLDLSICVPEWMPSRLELSLLQDEFSIAEFDCARGQILNEMIKLPRSSGTVEIRFSRVFSPAAMGLGEDTRLISASCDKFQIKSSEGTVLFDAFQTS